MEELYTVQQLAEKAGVSGRTLRYYDQIGLLKPERFSPGGYRLYGDVQTSKLQHILFLKELDMPLEDIREYLASEDFDRLRALKNHREKILLKQRRLEAVLHTIDRSIRSEEEGNTMTAEEKFKGLVEEKIRRNEAEYGSQARERWGDAAVDNSNARFRGKSKAEFEKFEALAAKQLQTLYAAQELGDPASDLALECAELHRQFLEFWTDDYSPEYHESMVRMYLDDPRFTKYYDEGHKGAAQFLHDAVLEYLRKKFNFVPSN